MSRLIRQGTPVRRSVLVFACALAVTRAMC